jgi:cell division protein FtsL
VRFFVLALVTIGAFVATAVNVIHERNRGVTLGFKIDAAGKEIQTLEEELHQLRIDHAALLDPRRLSPLAQKHGLHVATPDEIVPMSGETLR